MVPQPEPDQAWLNNLRLAALRLGRAVFVLEDRQDQARLIARCRMVVRLGVVEAMVAFHPAPGKVSATLDVRWSWKIGQGAKVYSAA